MRRILYRLFLFLAIVSSGTVVLAQQGPESGDTIWGHLPKKYYHNWWVYDDWTLTSTNDSVHACAITDTSLPIALFFGLRESYMTYKLTTDRPLTVLGLAGVCMVRATLPGTTYYTDCIGYPLHGVDPLTPEYFVLADCHKNDSLSIIRQEQWSMFDPHRTLAVPVKLHDDTYDCGSVKDTVLFFDIREYYFDEPAVVEDSFYVGGTNWSWLAGNEWPWYVFRDTLADYGSISTTAGYWLNHSFVKIDSCPTHYETYVINIDLMGNSIRNRQQSYCKMLIFPIVELPEAVPDTFSCPEPAGLRLMGKDTGEVMLQWQALPEQGAWTVGCCEQGQDFESAAREVDCMEHDRVRVTGLRAGTTYEFRVKAHCAHSDSLYLSGWSAPLLATTDTLTPFLDTLWLNDSTFVVGGELVTLGRNGALLVLDGQTYIVYGLDTLSFDDPRLIWLDDQTAILGGTVVVIPHEGISSLFPNPYSLNIFPNPTTGEVRVECGEVRVEKIEVLDPQGRLLMEKEYSPSPKPYTLNLSSLPKGSYIMRVTIPDGVASQIIVKQ